MQKNKTNREERASVMKTSTVQSAERHLVTSNHSTRDISCFLHKEVVWHLVSESVYIYIYYCRWKAVKPESIVHKIKMFS